MTTRGPCSCKNILTTTMLSLKLKVAEKAQEIHTVVGVKGRDVMARCSLRGCSVFLSALGLLGVILGFSTRYWFFCETSRWQFKCDLGACCVRDIDPEPRPWTCWPVTGRPKLFRLGHVLTCVGLALWLPGVLCRLVAWARLCKKRRKRVSTTGSCFLLLAGLLGVIGCNILFSTAREDFIIAEFPGASGYLVKVGSGLGLLGASLDLAHIVIALLQRVIKTLGTLLGCLAALVWVPLRAILSHTAPFAQRLKPVVVRWAAGRLRRLKSWTRRFWTSISTSSFPCRPCCAPVAARVRPRLLTVAAVVIVFLSSLLAFLETKMAAVFTFTFTKLAALVIILSPNLSDLVTSAQTFLESQTSFSRLMFVVVSHVLVWARDYLEQLIRPSFESTLNFLTTIGSSPPKKVLHKTIALQSVSIR